MVERSIIWTEVAIQQRKLIFEYWNLRNRSTAYSRKLLLQIQKRLSYLKKHPTIGKKVDFPETFAISLGYYLILYKISSTKIIVIAFWDNRRNQEELRAFISLNT